MPYYFASSYTGPVAADDNLDRLLTKLGLVQLQYEDVVIWCAGRIVAIRSGDGKVTWIAPQTKEVAP